MRAAVFSGSGEPLALTNVPDPSPGPGEVLVKVAGCGLCHTDLHYLDHGVATAHPPPLILGHEISGTVVGHGAGVEGPKAGSRVLLPAVLPCGACSLCRTGRGNICPKMRMFGNHIDGGFAELVVAPAHEVIPLPADVPLVRGSIIADAISTPYHAVVNRAAVRAGEWVVVVGCGGVGINAVQIASATGAQVIAVDLARQKLDIASKVGAAETLDASRVPDLGKAVRAITGEGADVAFEAVGTPRTVGSAISTLRRGGRLCLIGYSAENAPMPLNKIMFLEYTIMGSLGCRPVDYPKVIDLVRRGKVQLDPVISSEIPLERIEEGLGRLRRGEGLRTIVVP
ncbi:MAG: zinc-binding dehydrogenase [Euryarchaeota archaeon]|nr:zinc-binding dehydrogenase [Euryarchaeota archaeon]